MDLDPPSDAGRIAPRGTAIIGREDELAEIARLLGEQPHAVLLVGMAGAGKTTLARAYARSGSLPGGCAFCDVAGAKTVEDLCTAVARALDVPLTSADAADLPAQVGRALSGRDGGLIVIDNLEQLDPPARRVLAEWIERATATRFLLTSRENLHLTCARLLRVEPLGLPSDDESDPHLIAASPAVELFVFLTRRLRPRYSLEKSAGVVAKIVRKLDGLPLAIELAAARMSALGEQQLLDLLTHRLDFLTSVGTPSGRHATLRGALDASWEALSDDERRALARCSVFVGGFSLEAFEHVSLDEESASKEGSGVAAARLLQTLCDKSLVAIDDAPDVTGELRYRLYESIRDYAAMRLDARADGARALVRHAAYFAGTARGWAGGVHGHGGAVLRRRLATESDNLMAVFDRAVSALVPLEVGAEALLALEQVFLLSGPFVVYLRALHRLLDEGDRLGPGLRARAYTSRGWAALYGGRHTDALEDFGRALAFAPAEAAHLRALVHIKTGFARAVQGRAQDAARDFESARRLLDAAPDAWLEGVYWRDLAAAKTYGDDAPAVRAHLERALDLFRKAGARRDEGSTLLNLGALFNESGALADARDCLTEAARTLREVGDWTLLSFAITTLGVIAVEQGDFDEGRGRVDEALRIARRVGARHFEAYIMGYRGNVALDEEQFADACAWYERAAEALQKEGRMVGHALAGWASAEARLGRLEQAALHFEQAEAELERYRPGDKQVLRLLRFQLDLARAMREGVAGADAATLRSRVAAALEEAEQCRGPDELRFAVRVTRRALAAMSAAANGAIAEPVREIVVGPKGAWFEIEGAPRARIAPRSPIRKLLVLLAEERVSAAGRAVSAKMLFNAGWPGEKIGTAALMNRVWVAVSTLRRLGLRGALETHESGYRLDPRIPVRLCGDPDR